MKITNDSCCDQDICCSGTGTEIPDTVFDFNVSNALTTRDAYVTNKVTAGDARITNAVVSGLLVSENIRVSNLSVTGNFYVTATNTTTTNSFTIDNTGTTTALIVRQTEPTVHTHNVAEFYDATTPALIIDPEGNLAVHTTVSPNYAMTLVDGASFDVLTIRGNPPRTSLGVTGNVYASNAVTTTNVIASSVQLVSSTSTVPSGTLQFNSTAGIYNATIGTLRGITPTQYIYQLNGSVAGSVVHNTGYTIIPPAASGITLAVGKYFVKAEWYTTITTPASGTTVLAATCDGSATFVPSLNTLYARNASIGTNIIPTKAGYTDIVTMSTPGATYLNNIISFTGHINVTSPGTFLILARFFNSGGLATPSVSFSAGTYITIQPLGVTGANVNIGGWS